MTEIYFSISYQSLPGRSSLSPGLCTRSNEEPAVSRDGPGVWTGGGGDASGPPALGLKGSDQDFLGREYWPEAFPLSSSTSLENSLSSNSLEVAEGEGPCSVCFWHLILRRFPPPWCQLHPEPIPACGSS